MDDKRTELLQKANLYLPYMHAINKLRKVEEMSSWLQGNEEIPESAISVIDEINSVAYEGIVEYAKLLDLLFDIDRENF